MHWITQTAEQQIANIRYGRATCLPVDIPQGYEHKMQQFSFDWTQLKRVITDEAAHFAVRVSPTYLHIFTQRCSFGIDLSVPYAQVSLDETIWMTELVSLHQAKQALETELATTKQNLFSTQSSRDMWQRRADEFAAECSRLKQIIKTAAAETQLLKDKCRQLLSRCMKLVRRFAKQKKAQP